MGSFQGGEEEAFDRIVTEYQKVVYRFVLRTLRDHGRAEDLTQDVFVRVYNARARYRPTAKFRTWLFTIANRLILNELRARKRRRRVFVETTPRANKDDITTSAFETAEQTQEEAPAAQLERRELENLIEELVSGLAPNQQLALRLHRSAEVSYQEIADTLGVTLAAVKSLLVRARESLRQGLEGYLRGEQEKQEPGA